MVVDQFGGGAIFDIAVLNANGTIKIFENTSTTGSVSFNPTPVSFSVGTSRASSMTSGHVTGNAWPCPTWLL